MYFSRFGLALATTAVLFAASARADDIKPKGDVNCTAYPIYGNLKTKPWEEARTVIKLEQAGAEEARAFRGEANLALSPGLSILIRTHVNPVGSDLNLDGPEDEVFLVAELRRTGADGKITVLASNMGSGDPEKKLVFGQRVVTTRLENPEWNTIQANRPDLDSRQKIVEAGLLPDGTIMWAELFCSLKVK
jgi:hypothetical protein